MAGTRSIGSVLQQFLLHITYSPDDNSHQAEKPCLSRHLSLRELSVNLVTITTTISVLSRAYSRWIHIYKRDPESLTITFEGIEPSLFSILLQCHVAIWQRWIPNPLSKASGLVSAALQQECQLSFLMYIILFCPPPTWWWWCCFLNSLIMYLGRYVSMYWPDLGHMEFLNQGSDLSHGCGNAGSF